MNNLYQQAKEKTQILRYEIELAIESLVPKGESVILDTPIIFEGNEDGNLNINIQEVFDSYVFVSDGNTYQQNIPFSDLDIELLVEVLHGVEMETQRSAANG